MTLPKPLTLTIPMPPNNANPGSGSGHWSTLVRAKKRYFKMLDERQNCGLIPPPPSKPFERVTIAADMMLGRRMDDENAKYRCYKWPCDWLKTRGYIVDDKQPHCTMRNPAQIIQRAKDGQYFINLFLSTIQSVPEETV